MALVGLSLLKKIHFIRCTKNTCRYFTKWLVTWKNENTSNEQNIRSYHMLNHRNKRFIIPVIFHFGVFSLLVFKTYHTGAKDKIHPMKCSSSTLKYSNALKTKKHIKSKFGLNIAVILIDLNSVCCLAFRRILFELE